MGSLSEQSKKGVVGRRFEYLLYCEAFICYFRLVCHRLQVEGEMQGYKSVRKAEY
jgi:hypothetical protein